ERSEAAEQQTPGVVQGALSITVLAPIAVVCAALGWAFFWMGYDLFFDWLGTGVIWVPRLLEVVALICVAGLTGGPVGYLIKQVRRRGRHLSAAFAVVCTLAGVVAGETAYVAWLIYRESKVISLQAAWDILPQLWAEMGTFLILIKLLAAV